MTKSNKGFNWYFVVMLLVLVGMVWYTSLGTSDNNYSKAAFVQDLEAGVVTKVVIQPNAETPTGVVSVEKSAGGASILYVTDVNEIQDLTEEYGVSANIVDVLGEKQLVYYYSLLLTDRMQAAPMGK